MRPFPFLAAVPLFALGLAVVQPATAQPGAFIEAPLPEEAAFGYARNPVALPSKGTVNPLVIFAQFKDEGELGEEIPEFADDLFRPDVAGRFAHYYHTMSFGQLQVKAQVCPGATHHVDRHRRTSPARTSTGADSVRSSPKYWRKSMRTSIWLSSTTTAPTANPTPETTTAGWITCSS